MLRRSSYRRLFPRAWVLADHQMTFADWVVAAQLSLPGDARLTGITRLQLLGLEHGPRSPLHFVVARDHHIATDGIMLHRTDRLPPADDLGVTPTAAYLAYCAEATVIDAIVVGDWLLRKGHMSLIGLAELARHDHWRAGAGQALWIARHLDGRSWSPTESRTRAGLVFAGLPRPALNVEITVEGRVVMIVDIAYLEWRTVAEYEGEHHQTDRRQYLRDIDRYALLRDLELRYVQITKEHAANLTRAVRMVHAAMTAGGYRGPDPVFGRRWRQLFRRIPASGER